MKSNGEIHRYSKESESWRWAFRLFNQTFKDRLVMDCSKCVAKVHDWLKK